MSRKIWFLWALFFILAVTAIYLVLLFYSLLLSSSLEPASKQGIIPIKSIYGFGKSRADLFNKPHDVCVDNVGNLYVSDTRNARIVSLNQNGRLIRIYKDKTLLRPLGISVGSDGKVYVADRFASALIIFENGGNIYKRLAVNQPLKPVVNGQRVYLATAGSISVLDLDGKFLFHWGKYGRDNAEFSYPNGLAVSGSNTILVSDTNNLRVQAFTARGEFLWAFGAPANISLAEDNTKSPFSLPSGIAVDEKNIAYIVDAFANQVVVFDISKRKILKRYGQRGTGDGEFNNPSGIAYIKDGTFAVADKYNDRVQILKIAREPGKKLEETNRSNLFLQALIIALSLLLFVAFGGIVRWFLKKRRER